MTFFRIFMPKWEKSLISNGTRKRNSQSRMSMREVMIIIIAFHTSHHRDLKNFYKSFSAHFYKTKFLGRLSYTEFLELMPEALSPPKGLFYLYKRKTNRY
jgi:hypothetical protein